MAAGLQGQSYRVDSVTSSAKVTEIAGRPVTFGAKVTVEQLIADKFILSDTGKLVQVNINSVDMPEQLINIFGLQFLQRDYVVTLQVRIHEVESIVVAKKRVYVSAMFLTVEQIPHNKKAYSKALEKALGLAVDKLK
jgi:hypothetical protein